MQDSSTALTAVLQFRQDLQAKLRDGVRRAIETVLERNYSQRSAPTIMSARQHAAAIGTARPSAR